MKKWLVTIMVAVFGLASTLSYASMSAPDTAVDSLIAKLVEKGVLNKDEGDLLKGRVQYDSKVIQENNMKRDIPEWVQNTKIGGDMRVRFQDSLRKSTSSTSAVNNSQGRLRMRLNTEIKMNDKAKVVIGIASTGGANNARSNNVTFSGDSSTEAANKPFAKTNVVLNKAYGQYIFNDRLTLWGGKMDNPIWEPMEFLWDSDITPEGVAAKYEYKLNSMVTLSALGSFFMLNNVASSTSDPFVWVTQGTVMLKPIEKALDHFKICLIKIRATKE